MVVVLKAFVFSALFQSALGADGQAAYDFLGRKAMGRIVIARRFCALFTWTYEIGTCDMQTPNVVGYNGIHVKINNK